jgi:Fur family ferric uptake transcriptional regulator
MIDELDLMHLNGEKHYYEVKTQKDHLHVACFDCGKIEEFVSPTFERPKREIGATNNFEIQVIRLEVAANPGDPSLCLSLSQPSDVVFGISSLCD